MWLRVGVLCFLIALGAPCFAQTDLITAWKKQIVNRLAEGRRFPPEAVVAGQFGSAKVRFVLDRSGKLISSELMESTGFAALDAEAMAMVTRAQPFPAPPAEADGEHLKLVMPVNFSRRPPTAIDTSKEDAATIKEEAAVNAKIRRICRGC
jgi:protein TonB